MTPRLLPVLVLVACGCADYNAMEAAGDGDDLDGGHGYLRVDVHPSSENPDLLPQTHVLGGDWTGLQIDMGTPVRLRGQVQGYVATPHLTGVEVPGEEVPVEARVSAVVPGTVMAAAVMSDPETGRFELMVAPAEGYIFSVVPGDEMELPFLAEAGWDFAEDPGFQDVALGYGLPVSGRVTADTGLDPEEVLVRLRDPFTGVEGPAVGLDDDGYYLLRAWAGTWELVVEGVEGSRVPEVKDRIVVEEGQGTEVDIHLGPLTPAFLEAVVADAGSRAVEGATVRCTALDLDGFDGASLVMETRTDQHGRYRAGLLPGTWKVEYIAPYGRGLSPREDRIQVNASENQDQGTVVLDDFVHVGARVLGPDASPVEALSVTVTEVGFEEYTYTATTDATGWFELDVPDTDLEVVLSPAVASAAVTRIATGAGAFPERFLLESGSEIQGVVLHDDDPVRFALVEVRDSLDVLYGTTLTDGEGAFSLRVGWDPEADGETGSTAFRGRR